ncbi:MAG: pyridoxamine 5'-phosphate oxidase family protein [Thermomicrobiales bacterium]|nr:pyridoxamine 5'-phosphate oxidase family protein [Thermomicrobiales bacterium]
MSYVPNPEYVFNTVDALREIVGVPSPLIAEKSTPFVTPLVQQFIMSSPYFLVATAADDGTCDCTPRGDPPGAVYFPDARTLIFADRKGNRRVDSMQNMIRNPHVGLLFLIPGTDETVRVNGKATLSTDPELCEQLSQQGKPAQIVVIVEIEEVFTHCARSILRSKLWQPEAWPDTDTIPTLMAMLSEQKNLEAPDESQGKRNEEYRQVLY